MSSMEAEFGIVFPKVSPEAPMRNAPSMAIFLIVKLNNKKIRNSFVVTYEWSQEDTPEFFFFFLLLPIPQ